MLSTRITRFRHRPAIAAALALVGLAAVVLPQAAGAAPKQPKPTVASITKQLDQLARQAETLAEQFNGARMEISVQQRAATVARARQARAEAAYAAARKQFVPMVQAQYESDGMDSVGAILTSRDPGAYLDSLATQGIVSRHLADLLDQVNQARKSAEQAAATTDKHLAAARDAAAALKDKRQKVRDKTAKYQGVLAALTASQRAAYVNRGAPTPAEITAALRTPAPSAAAAKAVQFAVAQVGKPYVFGAAGPDAFDCSGLTMAAWAHAGVSLPHFSAAQYQRGRHVGYGQLEPGDLVFLYSDIHHVEIYVGGGLAISAPQEGEPVQFVHVADYRNDFYGATRLG